MPPLLAMRRRGARLGAAGNGTTFLRRQRFAKMDRSYPRLIGQREVTQMTSLSRAFIYKLMAAGDFPKSIPLAGNRVGWIHSEVLGWIEARVANARGYPASTLTNEGLSRSVRAREPTPPR